MFGIPLDQFLWLAAALGAGGAIVGVLAGLFGVGGGAIIVPILYEVFTILGVSEAVRMPTALGTSDADTITLLTGGQLDGPPMTNVVPTAAELTALGWETLN